VAFAREPFIKRLWGFVCPVIPGGIFELEKGKISRASHLDFRQKWPFILKVPIKKRGLSSKMAVYIESPAG